MPDPAPWRVVVADDDPDTRFLIRRALERTGRFSVVAEADDGEQAVTLAKSHQPQVVLLDLEMPGVDGLTAVPRVRAVTPHQTAVVVISAHRGVDRLAHRAVAEGAAAFITKDPGFERLVADLLEVTGQAVAEAADDAHAVHWDFPAELTSGAKARHRLQGLLDDWDIQGLSNDAQLLATELINNAILHARSDVRLTVKLRDDSLRLEVTDKGGGALQRPDTTLDDTSGRGLMLVDAIAAEWGTVVKGRGKTVWAQLTAG